MPWDYGYCIKVPIPSVSWSILSLSCGSKLRNETEGELWNRNQTELGGNNKSICLYNNSETSWVILDEQKLWELHSESRVSQTTLLQGCQFKAVFFLFIRSGTEELGFIIRSLRWRLPSSLHHAYFGGILLWFEPQGVLLNYEHKSQCHNQVEMECIGMCLFSILDPLVLNNILSHHLYSGIVRTNLASTLHLCLLATSIECLCIPFLREILMCLKR